MKEIAPKILRFLINILIKSRFTYFPFMAFFRLSRKMRKRYYSSNNTTEMTIVNNCMGNISMKVDKNSYMGGSIYWAGFHHANEMIFLKSYLKENMVFVDIGANQGEFTLFAASKLTKGKVISFEPVSKQYNSLMDNIQLNNFANIQVNKYGLSNEETTLPIYTSTDTELHSGVHEGLSTLYKSEIRSELEETVDLKIFDKEFDNKLTQLDFVKIDIEGAELFALKGMKAHLEKFKPVILIELNDETFQAAGYSITEVVNFLNQFGYSYYKIHRGQLVKQLDIFSDWGNYIFKIN